MEKKLEECKDEVFVLLDTLSKQIIHIESCLAEKCGIDALPTDTKIALDITKSGYNILHSSIELLFMRLSTIIEGEIV